MSCEDCRPKDLKHSTEAYRRVLWVVAFLNLAMGAAEIVGGILGRSQALKADALDFVGDGAITLLGLVAIHRGAGWRAKSALVQSVFLAMMGTGVFFLTLYRVFAQQLPEAETMGLFGLVAFCVNIGAALLLIPHRKGDANVRAVWLFSRNDALGNLAVVAAAGLVAWTQTPWPDLVVAVFVGVLFLHSSWSIFKDAKLELAQMRPALKEATGS